MHWCSDLKLRYNMSCGCSLLFRKSSPTGLIPKRFGSRGRGIVVKTKDVGRLEEKYQRMFTKMSQKKFGIRGGYATEDLLLKIEAKGSMPNQLSDRRVKVYETILLSHVLDLVSSDVEFEKLRDFKLEISQVKFLKDFSFFNIYWIASGTSDDIEIQAVLNESAETIRYKLTQFNVIGRIPRVRFLPDLSAVKLSHIENLLNTAEYPADHQPCKVPLSGMRSDPMLRGDFESQKQLDGDTIGSSMSGDQPDILNKKIFGLNRDELLKVLKSRRSLAMAKTTENKLVEKVD